MGERVREAVVVVAAHCAAWRAWRPGGFGAFCIKDLGSTDVAYRASEKQ